IFANIGRIKALGSLERFTGILIEHYAGAFPMWLAPTQIVVASISEGAADYAKQAAAELRRVGLRVETDLRSEKINYKVREHSVQKVPIIAVVGAKEAEEHTLALRRFGSKAQEIMSLEESKVQLVVEALAPDLKRARDL
ncbi:MAG: His/Gly/Thr/Pro-type tRNA ligase C-terminal domain-containing protein, partial [Pseudomonadota bacterium]